MEANLNGKHSFFRLSTPGSSFLTHISLSIFLTCTCATLSYSHIRPCVSNRGYGFTPPAFPCLIFVHVPLLILFQTSKSNLSNRKFARLYFCDKELQESREKREELHRENEALKEKNEALRQEIATLKKK